MSTRERASQSRSEAASGTPSPDSGSGTKTACANAAGTLYVVATPIGNLGDITYRAVEVLGTVDRVLAEDTRRSRRLFDHYGLNTDLVALHEHNETAMVSRVLAWLADGQSLALISDAGTPLINDPGYVVSQAVLAANGRVVPIPGASAVTTALSAAGIATNRFIFEGFVPPKESARQRTFERWVREERTVVYYESSHRIMASLVGLAKVVGAERQVVVGRELTKVFETFYRGALSDVIVTMRADANAQKGEFVVLLDGAAAHDSSSAEIELDALLTALLQEVPVSQAVRLAQAVTGERKNTIYQRAIALDAEIE